MTLKHLRIFVTVCESESVTAASKKLYLAQPAVSLAIKELEDYYQIKLFDRISKRLFLTEAGKRLLNYARHITSLFDEMETEIKNWDAAGELRIGSSITIGTELMPQYVRQFSEQFPHIKIQVLVYSSDIIEDKILKNELDLALIEGVPHSSYLISKEFQEDELVIICSPEHPLINSKDLTFDQIKSEPFLLREKGSGTRNLVDSLLVTHGISLNPIWEGTSTRALINACAEGLGISILPYRLVRRELGENKIKILNITDLEFKRMFRFIYHQNKYLTPAALSFMELCQTNKK